MIKKLLAIIYGAVYGIANVIPGASGGTFLVIFGCYDTVCQALALNFKEIKKNILFLILFGAGVIAAIIGFSRAVMYLFDNFPVQTYLFFMGLILGGVPLILRLAKESGKMSLKCVLPFLFGLALVLAFFFADRYELLGGDASQTMNFALIARLVAGSFVAAFAMIIPGISGASMLVATGVYDTLIEAVAVFDFSVIIPAGIGILLGVVCGAKIILFLLKKFKLMVYCAILGMVIGSAVPLFYQAQGGLGLNIATLIGVLCLAAGGALAWYLGRKETESTKI